MLRQLLVIISCISTCGACAQQIATLQVHLARLSNGVAVPIETDLDAITFLPDSALDLLEVDAHGHTFSIPFQIENAGHRTLHWIADLSTEYYLLVTGAAYPFDPIRAVANDGALTIFNGNQHLLQYVYNTVYPPPGIDTFYKKSGFIHPLYTPQGQILTRIQPPDHYHHYGIWDPWTHILFNGDTIDCWNLAARKGTQRFAKFTSIVSGPVFAQFQALQQHVAFHRDGSEDVFLNELQTTRIYRSFGANYYLLDITIDLTPATLNPVKLLAYRYGGLGWRATAEWNRENSQVLTSEGKDRRHADGTKARWCIVQGALGGAYGGAAILSSPSNYNHPEPLRIWPDSSNGRGDLFANFSPTKDTDWLLEPGHTYTLHYRWVVFNGHFTKEEAESAWQYFARPPSVTASLVKDNATETIAPSSDTLTATVAEWNKLPIQPTPYGDSRQVLKGSTRDLSRLDVRAYTLFPGKSFTPPQETPMDHLLIIRQGRVIVTAGANHKELGPGGVGLFAVGEEPALLNTGTDNVSFYLFSFASKGAIDRDRATKTGGPLLMDWPEIPMKKTDKGESRPIFSRPEAWLGTIDMHATTLNPGEISHPQHMHRNEEIILMRSGHVRMHIADGYRDAASGDLVFLPSGVPHDLENGKTGPCEYFALQWQQ
jgi:mannose-6-phosphate isomerase-like protein (cupin superfamily)